MELTQIVTANIRRLRSVQKMSQEELARKAQLSVSYVSKIENDLRVPTLDTLEVISKALGVSPLLLMRDLRGCVRKPD